MSSLFLPKTAILARESYLPNLYVHFIVRPSADAEIPEAELFSGNYFGPRITKSSQAISCSA